MKLLIAMLVGLVCLQRISSQSLLQELEADNNVAAETEYTEGTFKATRLINGQTVETTEKRGLNVVISHRFGEIKSGSYDLFGIDQSVIRLGLEYGITDRISLGYGRGNFQKLHDGYFKIKLLQQSTGLKNMPVTLCWYSNITMTSQRWTNPGVVYEFSSRLNYVHELLLARKFSPKFSAQVALGMVHRNFVATRKDQNNVPYSGLGARMLVSRRLAIIGEYYYLFPGEAANKKFNSLSFGVDIETGGHVFQIHLSNSRGMTEKIFVAENGGDWSKGEISLGFNIIRTFKL